MSISQAERNATQSLRYWKGRATRLVNAVAKSAVTLKPIEIPFIFPAALDDLEIYVLQKTAEIAHLKEKLLDLDIKLTDALGEGLKIVQELTEDDGRDKLEAEFETYANNISTHQSSLEDSLLLVETRSLELTQQQQILNLRQSRATAALANQRTALANNQQTGRYDSTVPRSTPTDSASVLKRPRPTLPVFKGNVRKFGSFWSAYTAMVHDVNDLDDVEKFFYLREALKDDALQLIEEIPVTNENYEKAIQLLKHRYDLGINMTTVIINDLQKIRPATANTKEIRKTVELIRQKIITLECQGETFSDYNVWRSLILSKFPVNVNTQIITKERRLVLNGNGTTQKLTVELLLNEIADFVQLLECVDMNVETHCASESTYHINKSVAHQAAQPDKNKSRTEKKVWKWKCVCQSTDHKPWDCTKFSTPSLRRQEAQRTQVCFICFKNNHLSKDCKLGPCPDCNENHHSSLCEKRKESGNFRQFNKTNTNNPNAYKTKPQNVNCALDEESSADEVLLLDDNLDVPAPSPNDQVILMHVTGDVFNQELQKFETVNIFIDDGAATSLIRKQTCADCRLSTQGPYHSRISGVGGQVTDLTYHLASATLRSNAFGEANRKVNLKTIQEICLPLRTATLTSADWSLIREKGIHVNQNEAKQARIDILIGQDCRKHFVYELEPKISLPSGLFLTKTIFGYAISGCTSSPHPDPSATTDSHVVGVITEDPSLYIATPVVNQELEEFKSDVKNLYNLETLGIRAEQDQNEVEAMSFMDSYRETIEIGDGHVTAGFPFMHNVKQLKDNFSVALKQLQNQLKRLKPEHIALYEKTFAEYVKQGIIEVVSADADDGTPTFYLPHHPVICEDKSTSFRVVYNASSHARGELSLNDTIFPGYSLMALIFEVLMKFRSNDFVMTADIQKAFLQVHLPDFFRNATRFLWVKDPSKPATGSNLKYFRFCRLPFGINASPAILNQVILKHLELVNTETSKELAETIYVDNALLHALTENELFQKYKESKEIFKSIGMNLRDYLSNSKFVNDSLPDIDRATTHTMKILGIPWDAESDTLTLELKTKDHIKWTTRTVLSQVNGACYDPLGLMSPYMVAAKVFLQSLHIKKKKWDELLTEDELVEWTSIREAMIGSTITLPRCVSQRNEVLKRQLMVFTDSSKKAYGCAAYVTTTTNSGDVYSRIYASKMRVTPMKTVTIPRLELTGILTGAKLISSILLQSSFTFDEVHLFTDSTIALAWVHSKRLLPPFIREAVLKIQGEFSRIKEYTTLETHHVPTEHNVADYATRGMDNTDRSNHIWWTGSVWLTQNRAVWPTSSPYSSICDDTIEDVLVTVEETEGKISFDSEGGIWPVSRIGSYPKLCRVTAYALRFIQRITKGKCNLPVVNEEHKNVQITGLEMKTAERFLIRQEQQKTDIPQMLRQCCKLNLQMDQHGILRKHSRLNNSTLDYNEANPIFIPSKSILALRILANLHVVNYHRKGTQLLVLVQRKFWIPGAKRMVEKFTKSCFGCSIFNRPYKYPLLADLPKERVQKAHAFAFTGTDLFGPLLIKTTGNNVEKRWIALFTCFVTRMVHLEIVKDLSAKAYLLAFRRFTSRRGVPQKIWSDNGTNFTLAAKLQGTATLSSDDQAFSTFVADHHVQWIFIPPGAPWMGGTWERMVGIVKKPLLQAIGNRRIEEDLLHTLICGVEATVNNRPLHVSQDKDGCQDVLRPIDFCQPRLKICSSSLEPIDSEDPDFLPDPIARSRATALRAIADIEAGLDRFWKKFHKDYLLSIKGIFNKRHMDYASTDKVPKEGDMVLINEDKDSPRHHWPRGIVDHVIISKDGATRSAFVRVSNGKSLHRPINKLIPLAESSEPVRSTFFLPISQSPQHVQTPLQKEDQESNRQQRQPQRKCKQVVQYVSSPSSSRRSSINHTMMMSILMLDCMVTPVMPSPVVLNCIKGGVFLNLDRISVSPPVTSEICVNSRSCLTILSSGPQAIYVDPSLTVNDYKVQWRTLLGSTQMLETANCLGTPNCELIDCWFCSQLLGNPHCWPQATIVMVVFWIYTAFGTLALLWCCCLRKFLRRFCFRKLTAAGRCLVRYAKRTCGKEIVVSDDDEAAIPLNQINLPEDNDSLPIIVIDTPGRKRILPSRLVTILHVSLIAVMLLGSGVDACQRITVLDSHLAECINNNGSCTTLHSLTVSMSHFRRDLCIRATKNTTILRQIRIHLEAITLRCRPQVLYFTRNVELKTYSKKRCTLAGSCNPWYCDSVSARTAVPELSSYQHLPGISRCSESCGGIVCGCALPLPGCLFSRTVAEPVTDDIFEVFNCPSWNVQARIRYEEINHNGSTKSMILAIRQQTSLRVGTTNVSVDFVATPASPILASIFMKKVTINSNQTSTGVTIPSQEMIALQCATIESASNLSSCFLLNTCSCAHSPMSTQCDCRTFNITDALLSLDRRLPLNNPEMSLSLNNGILSADSHMSVAEITLSSHINWNSIEVTEASCRIETNPVEGCYNCISGAIGVVNCRANKDTIATIDCEDQDFAISCNSTGIKTELKIYSTQAKYQQTCSISCSKTTLILQGVLIYSSSVKDNQHLEESPQYNNLFNSHLPEFSRILDVLIDNWKTTLIFSLLPLAAVLITIACAPSIFACVPTLFMKAALKKTI